jgi:hypothetical protein
MKITFILIIIYLLNVYANETYTKYKLRNLAIKGRNKLINYMIDTEYENIYNTVLQEATLDKTNLTFTILCVDHYQYIQNNNIYKSILAHPGVIEKSRYKMFKSESNNYINEIGNHELFSLAQIYKIKIETDPYKISNDFITSKIIDKLKIKFPESNIILNKEQPPTNSAFNNIPFKCTYYTLDW